MKINIEEIVTKLQKVFDPVSIVLYGSRARTDFLERSDHELGLFYSRDRPVTWNYIRQVVSQKGVNIYPFVYEDFLHGKIDAPFQKTIYKRELIVAGRTLFGVNIQVLTPPSIRINDLIEDVRFNSGYALASLISLRNGDDKSALLEFYKSCLFATRSPIMLHTGQFPLTYDNIIDLSRKVYYLQEYQELIEKAYQSRQGKGKIEVVDLINNITYINNFIEPMLKERYEKDKEMIVVL